jgi:pilus assembly protein Flp/PilA
MERINLSKRIGRKTQFGQGMIEYIIIMALIAIGAIAAFTFFGHTVQSQIAEVANGLAGNTSGVATAVADQKTDTGNANTAAEAKLGLDNYGTQNVKQQ